MEEEIENNNDEEIGKPCIFKSTTPGFLNFLYLFCFKKKIIISAWNNFNLSRLASKISSSLIFAHVRAAFFDTNPSPISEANCHPFQHEKYLFMHNGLIENFSKINRKIRESLSDEYFNFIQGTTDSEVIFALFLNQLEDIHKQYKPTELCEKILLTLKKLEEFCIQGGLNGSSLLNFAVYFIKEIN